jgi:LytTR family transcriptional regulator, CO-responsive transcriptional regulator RcoM
MRHPSPLYLLERFEVGLVQLDSERRVVGMNDYARRVLPVEAMQPFDRMVLSFHPERSQPKVEFLLDTARQCPVANPPPMTMIINIPERVLLIKVSRLGGAQGEDAGYVLVFHDITDFVAADSPTQAPAGTQRRLAKIPTVAEQTIVFVDAEDILGIESSGHYTRVITAGANRFCNLGIGDIEARLDPEHFLRVHRSYLVNLRAVSQLLREDGRIALRLDGHDGTIPVSRASTAMVLQRLGLPGGVPQAARQG